jgi:hypothetical protein
MTTITVFLSAICGPNAIVNFRCFGPRGCDVNQPEYRAEKYRFDLSNGDKMIAKQFLEIWNKSRGIYFVPNGGGDTDADINVFNAVFCESDNISIAEQNHILDAAPVPTSIRVETSKSVHAYWLLKPGCVEVQWREIQSRIIAYFGSDPALKNPSRVMRLPGFNHVRINAEGELSFKRVELRQFERDRRYSAKELLAAFPSVQFVPKWEYPQDPGGQGQWRRKDENRWELAISRIKSLPDYTVRKNGWGHAQGICHKGNSTGENGSLCISPSGYVHCLNGCESEEILSSLGVPEMPDGDSHAEASESDPVEEEWPDPSPIEDASTPVELLEPDMLPDVFRGWLEDVAQRMDVPIDYPAAAALVAFSAVVGRRAYIIPKKHDIRWRVTPNLWGAIVGRPGLLKTPSIREGIAPLIKLEDEAQIENLGNKKEYVSAFERFRIRKSAWVKQQEKSAKNGGTIIGFEGEEPQEPKEKRLLSNDATMAKLHELLEANPSGILMLRDELSGWFQNLDAPGREGERSFFLEAWDGGGSFTIDRIGRGSLHCKACCVSVLGGIQPSKLMTYGRDAVSFGAGDDGLLQRLQILTWPDVSADVHVTDRAPNLAAYERFEELFRKASMLDPVNPLEYRFAPDAQGLFDEWRQELEVKIKCGACMRQWSHI